MPTAELRELVRRFPTTRLMAQIADTRRTMRGPTYTGPGLVGGRQGPDVVFCARFIAVCRAERSRRTHSKRGH